jgi:hypothetical protein
VESVALIWRWRRHGRGTGRLTEEWRRLLWVGSRLKEGWDHVRACTGNRRLSCGFTSKVTMGSRVRPSPCSRALTSRLKLVRVGRRRSEYALDGYASLLVIQRAQLGSLTTLLCSHMHECRPSFWRCSAVPQLCHGIVERIGNRVDVDGPGFEYLLVEALGNKRPVLVAHSPVLGAQLTSIRGLSTTYHMVATTLLNPAKSIVAARCTTSSACWRAPFAVSHALRNAKKACLRSISITSATERVPSLKQK